MILLKPTEEKKNYHENGRRMWRWENWIFSSRRGSKSCVILHHRYCYSDNGQQIFKAAKSLYGLIFGYIKSDSVPKLISVWDKEKLKEEMISFSTVWTNVSSKSLNYYYKIDEFQEDGKNNLLDKNFDGNKGLS